MGPEKSERITRVVVIDHVRWRQLRLVVGALILVCLPALGCSSAGAEKKNLASDSLPTAEQASVPSGSTRAWEPWDPVRQRAQRHWAESQKAEEVTPEPKDAPSTCGDLQVLVGRSHPLPPDYAPGDLVPLPDHGVPTLGGRDLMLRREAAEHLGSLSEAAAADGQELVVASAFRSYTDQQVTYERLESIYGSGADAMSAAPGHSQHQLGTAVDFTNAAAAYQVQQSFGSTSAAGWLYEHATAYGFVLAYPPGEDGTAYDFEPWHYRYVGVDNARRLEESGLTPQKFLVREGILPEC